MSKVFISNLHKNIPAMCQAVPPTLTRLRGLWSVYRKVKNQLAIGGTMQEAYLNIIEACLSAASPVSVNGEIDDLSSYGVIYWDGTFSNDKLEILYNPNTNQLILHEHTLWQGGFCGYKNFSLEQYVRMLPDDEGHFNRWLEGLRKIIGT